MSAFGIAALLRVPFATRLNASVLFCLCCLADCESKACRHGCGPRQQPTQRPLRKRCRLSNAGKCGLFKVAARVVVAIGFPLSVDRRLIHSFVYTEDKPLSCAWAMRQTSRYVVRLGTACERLEDCPSSPGEP
jgi:hypothetical protein